MVGLVAKMEIVCIAIAWWSLGTSSVLWLQRGNNITWGGLFVCLMLGVLGPGLWVIIGITILAQASFWSKPVFGKYDKK
jgi:hypothetical protein